MSSIGITITAQGLDAFRNADAAGIVARLGQQLGEQLAENVAPVAAAKAPQWQGDLAGSIAADGNRVTVGAGYGPFVHGLPLFGAPDRSVPHWPPKGALTAWAEDHGLPEFLVRRAISRHGTPLVHFLADAAQERPGFDAAEQQTLDDLKAALLGGA